MKYLIFLNKFNLDKNKLKNKISLLDDSVKFDEEENSIIISSKLEPYKFMNFQEISKLIILFSGWEDFSFKSIKEKCLGLCVNKNIKNYFIETKFYDKVPISSKSIYRHINPYLKHENLFVDEEKGHVINIEFKKFDNKLKYRLGYSQQKLFNKVNPIKVDMSKFVVVIENPSLVSEVSDFLRLCWIFKLPLYVMTKDKSSFERLLKKAKEETKGIDYAKFELKISNDLPKSYTLVGFSKHSLQNEKDMKNILLKQNKIALVFGDDKYGLTQDTRDKLNYVFRLTPETKKPLRASQALSYVLGFYTAYNI